MVAVVADIESIAIVHRDARGTIECALRLTGCGSRETGLPQNVDGVLAIGKFDATSNTKTR